MRASVQTVLFGLVLSSGPVMAAEPVTTSKSTSAHGAIASAKTVDPGMVVVKPPMPAAGTPVIKPKTTAPDGTVVVPK